MPSSFAGQQQDCSLFPSFFCLSFCLLLSLSQISFSSSMNPVYQISPPLPSPFSIAEPNDENHHYLQLFSPSSKASASSESSSFLSNSIFSNLAQEHGSAYDRDLQQGVHQEEAMKCVFKVGSNAHHEVLESPSLPTVDHDLMNGQQTSVYEGNYGDQYQSNGGSVKWMSSKMRLMKKMSNSDRTGVDIKVENKNKFQDHQNPPTSPLDTENSSNSYSNNNSSTTTVRVCSDCYTTKTPLWRSGPRGPKSLCNACGIRQRKARRAMAAAAAVASGGLLGNEISSMKTNVSKDKRSDNNGYTQQYKKRFKFTGPCSRNKICFEDFTINLSKNSAFHQVFPQDEKEAAILLMALSCGLILL